MRTTVVVVTWRGAAHVADCLAALAAQDRPHRTLVVDNASDDGTAELLACRRALPGGGRIVPDHEVLRLPRNTGYAGGIAAALSVVDTEFVAWCNDDAAPRPGWLAACEAALDAHPKAGAVAATLRAPDGRGQSRGTVLTADGYGADTADGAAEPFGFCGGAALLRTAALRAVGGVPAEFFCYYEDTDTAWRLRLAGHKVVAEPDAVADHLHGASTRPGSVPFHRWNERNRLLMLARCAPLHIAAWQACKFVLLLARRDTPATPNFTASLRLRVLGEVAARLPALVAQRRAIGRVATTSRARVWRRWAGTLGRSDQDGGTPR